MIHAYREQYAEIIQLKTAEMFELGVLKEKISIDKFSEAFASSRVANAFEMMDRIQRNFLLFNRNSFNGRDAFVYHYLYTHA